MGLRMNKLLEELNKLPENIRTELGTWFIEKIYKTKKVLRNERLNYVPYVKRRQVIWVDFGFSIGQEIKGSHPAIVLFTKDSSGTVIVIPLTTKENECQLVVDIGAISGMDNTFSHAKVDQITSISKLRIQTKRSKNDNKYYNNYNKSTGIYNNPKLTAEQMDIIDNTIKLFQSMSQKS